MDATVEIMDHGWMKTYTELVSGGKSDASKVKLILTAERLFAERGIDGVSLREVAFAAGSANNNAVQYHFQSKERLLYAIYAFRIGQMEQRRAEMLAQAEAAGLLGDAATLLRILCLPHLELSGPDGSHPYAAFLVEFVTRYWRPGLAQSGVNTSVIAPTLHRLMALLADVIGVAPPEIARSRALLCNLMFLNALLRWDHVDRHVGGQSMKTVLNDALAAMEGALRAPHPTKPSPSLFDATFPMLNPADAEDHAKRRRSRRSGAGRGSPTQGA